MNKILDILQNHFVNFLECLHAYLPTSHQFCTTFTVSVSLSFALNLIKYSSLMFNMLTLSDPPYIIYMI